MQTRMFLSICNGLQAECPPCVRFGQCSGVLRGASRGRRRGVLVAGCGRERRALERYIFVLQRGATAEKQLGSDGRRRAL